MAPRSHQPTAKEREAAAAAARLLTRLVETMMKPMSPRDAAAARAERDKRVDELEKYVNLQMQINLGAWQQQSDNAITDASYPSDENSRYTWYIALGGNLLWAATCFINPGTAAGMFFIKNMSVYGAFLGSGGFEHYAGVDDEPSPEEGKKLVRQALALKRGELEAQARKDRRSWAEALDGIAQWDEGSSTLIDQFDAYLWKSMFPTIPFGPTRFEAIRSQALKVIELTLADYNRQFKAWRIRYNIFGGAEKKRRGIKFVPVLKIEWAGVRLSGTAEEIGGRLLFH